MKSILISIKPKYVAKILNGEKTIEIRKTMPNCALPIDVHIYCTKDSSKLLHKNCADIFWVEDKEFQNKSKKLGIKSSNSLNGKVVAKFTLNKISKFYYSEAIDDHYTLIKDKDLPMKTILEEAGFNDENMIDFVFYMNFSNGYAWHIDNLKIFDKSRELSEFRKPNTLSLKELRNFGLPYNEKLYKDMMTKGKYLITKAPQSWCYCESEE